MSKDWRWWLVKSIFYAIALFIVDCVIFKLLIGLSNWLEMSIIWSISFSLGHFVGKSFRLTFVKALTITVSILVIFAFLFGVVLDMQDWYIIVSKLSAPFIMAMYFYGDIDFFDLLN